MKDADPTVIRASLIEQAAGPLYEFAQEDRDLYWALEIGTGPDDVVWGRVASVVLDALNLPAKLAAAEELAETLQRFVDAPALAAEARQRAEQVLAALVKYREATR